MAETEFEKIVCKVFADINPDFADRWFHNLDIEKDGKTIWLPWFCSEKTDKQDDFLKLLKDPYYFYRCGHNGMITEYVVTPHFHAMVKHDASCIEPKICSHTADYVYDLLFEPREKFNAVVDFLLSGNLYDDRLQFLLTEPSSDRHMAQIALSPQTRLDEKGEIVICDENTAYGFSKWDVLKTASRPALKIFAKIESMFGQNIDRDDISACWELPQLLKEAIKQDYSKKNA